MKHTNYSVGMFHEVSAFCGMKPDGNVAGKQVSNGEYSMLINVFS